MITESTTQETNQTLTAQDASIPGLVDYIATSTGGTGSILIFLALTVILIDRLTKLLQVIKAK